MTTNEQRNQAKPAKFSQVALPQKATSDNPQFDRATELALIARLQQGEEEAWQQFVNDYSPHLYNHLRAQLSTPDEASDVLSDTFLGLVQAMRAFDGHVSLSTFAYAMADRKVADYWQHKKHRVEGPTPEPLALHGIAQLRDGVQLIVLMRYAIGYSITEIAEGFGMSYQEAEVVLKEARQALAATMDQQEAVTEQGPVALQQRTLLRSVLQMAYDQQQRCLERNMRKEAEIFQGAIHYLQQLIKTDPASAATA